MRFQGIVAIVAVALLLAAAPAGATSHGTVTLVTDPAGDQDVTNPCLDPDMPNFDGVDITAITIGPTDGAAPNGQESYVLSIQTTGAATASQGIDLSLNITKGPQSLPGSTADGQAVTLFFRGTAPPFGFGQVEAGAGGLRYTFKPSDLHAVGGDVLHILGVAAGDRTDGALPPPVTQDDCSGEDSVGAGTTAFTFLRPPVASNLAVAVTGGKAFFANNTSIGFSGSFLVMDEAPQRIVLDVRIENKGLDPDTVEVTARTSKATVLVKPGAAETVALTLQGPFGVGTGTIGVFVKPSLPLAVGGSQPNVAFTLTISPTPPVAEREVIPAGLAFLTPLATGVGLDGPLGSYAELAILLLALVLLVALLFLLATLSRPWVKAHAETGHIVAPIGGSVQVELAVDRVRRGVQSVRAVLRQAGWPATVGGQPTIDLPPDGRAILRVEVPSGAVPKDRQTIEVDLVPIAADGSEHPSRAAHAKVTVQAGLPTTPMGPRYTVAGIELAGVRHEPPQPRPGETVVTTATVRNGAASPAPLRVALTVDGQVRAERRIEVPARSAAEVPLDWVAGAGANQVKVQVFLA